VRTNAHRGQLLVFTSQTAFCCFKAEMPKFIVLNDQWLKHASLGS